MYHLKNDFGILILKVYDLLIFLNKMFYQIIHINNTPIKPDLLIFSTLLIISYVIQDSNDMRMIKRVKMTQCSIKCAPRLLLR